MARRRRTKQTENLLVISIFIALASLAIGLYIEYQLRQYASVLTVFAQREKGWRDEAFGVAMWSGIAAGGIVMIRSILRRL